MEGKKKSTCALPLQESSEIAIVGAVIACSQPCSRSNNPLQDSFTPTKHTRRQDFKLSESFLLHLAISQRRPVLVAEDKQLTAGSTFIGFSTPCFTPDGDLLNTHVTKAATRKHNLQNLQCEGGSARPVHAYCYLHCEHVYDKARTGFHVWD